MALRLRRQPRRTLHGWRDCQQLPRYDCGVTTAGGMAWRIMSQVMGGGKGQFGPAGRGTDLAILFRLTRVSAGFSENEALRDAASEI